MFNYVPRVLVGKASGAVSTAQTPGTILNVSTVVTGDIYVVSEDLVVLDAASAATAEVVRIARASSAGKIILSAPIVRSLIKKPRGGFTFQAYSAPVAQVDTINASTLVSGKQYRLIIVIKDDLRLIANRQNRGSFHFTYDGTNLSKLVAQINRDRHISPLLSASVSGSNILLSGKPVLTESINDYEFVSFESTLTDVTAGEVAPKTFEGVTAPEAQGGQGLAVQVRQMERMAYGGLGVTDLRNFDRPVPAFAAVDGVGYDVFHILSRVQHQGALQQVMSSPVQTTIAVATNSAQKTAIEVVLNAFVAGTATSPPAGE